GLDAGIRAHHHGERLRVQREHRAQVLERALVLEAVATVEGMVLDVRLDHAEVELARADAVQVEHRAFGALGRAADAVLGPSLSDQAADRAPRRVVHAGDSAGPDRDELLLLGLSGTAQEQSAAGQKAERDAATGSKVHLTSPWFWQLVDLSEHS